MTVSIPPGFDTVREREVGVAVIGKPRWWTVTKGRDTLEIVRIDLTDKNPIALFYVIMPVGAFAHPPFVGSMFKLGEAAFDYMDEKGWHWEPVDTAMGRALELRLVGMGRQR